MKHRRKALSEREVRRLIEAAKSDRDKLIIWAMLYCTGLGVSILKPGILEVTPHAIRHTSAPHAGNTWFGKISKGR